MQIFAEICRNRFLQCYFKYVQLIGYAKQRILDYCGVILKLIGKILLILSFFDVKTKKTRKFCSFI
jgi:hypothetical protein